MRSYDLKALYSELRTAGIPNYRHPDVLMRKVVHFKWSIVEVLNLKVLDFMVLNYWGDFEVLDLDVLDFEVLNYWGIR